MKRENQKNFLGQLALLLDQRKPGGDLSPARSAQDWERVVERTPVPVRELMRELARFADLWRYLNDREQQLGSQIVDQVCGVHKLPLARRIARLRSINDTLIDRICDAGQGSQLRQ